MAENPARTGSTPAGTGPGRSGTGDHVPADSTLTGVRDAAGHGWKRWVRDSVVVLLVVVVAAGATGWLGVRSATATDSGSGYRLSVEYPLVARAGLDVPWRVTVESSAGFDGRVTVAVTTGWFELFETQGLSPAPASESSDAAMTYFVLDPPPAGNVLTLDYDAYVQPAAQTGAEARVELLVDGQRVAAVDYRTWVLP
jgi:hypothetical protein